MLDEAQRRAKATYNAAADGYDHPANSFWERFGRRTIDRLDLQAGMRVLDVCCGSGASAIVAAEKVGAEGLVIGIDLAESMLERGREKAHRLELRNVEFRVGDMLDLPLPVSHFDAVICVFGVFFVPDMQAAIRALWRMVRPTGKLAITTWGPRWFEPGSSAFWNSIREVRPDLYKGFNPWDRICDPDSLLALMREAGVENAAAVAEDGWHPIPSADAWWRAALGSGYRGTLEQLSAPERELVHSANVDFIHRTGCRAVEANVVYANATKPSS
jgi:ubiquinone/menaquinone biosynthesis C-methylase UbiE